ncbi:MAG: hypothetical protein AB7G87_14815 [Clostridia bacterium]
MLDERIIKIGDMGVKVLDSKPVDRANELRLCHIINHTLQPFVVWHYNKENDSYYWGKYCKTEREARKYFNE